MYGALFYFSHGRNCTRFTSKVQKWRKALYIGIQHKNVSHFLAISVIVLKKRKPHYLCVCRRCCYRQMKIYKLTPKFNPTRLRITAVNCSRIMAWEIDGTWTIIRDASYLRMIMDKITKTRK